MVTDVIIIGGGAAGLAAAVYLKQKNKDLSVRVFEALPRVGKKLALTGNGRCNISNKNIELSRYHGENPEFCRFALEKFGLEFTEEFFKGIGVLFSSEGNKVYPSSFQASSVVDCLRFACDELGVITHLETKITNIQTSKNLYKVSAKAMSFLAKNVIIATGLYSGTDRLGCDGEMFSLLKKVGFEASKTTPSLVQLKTENEITKQLKGIKTDALVSLYKNGKAIRTDFGEVLFCDYGLSGPPILQLSRETARDNAEYKISLDLFSDSAPQELEQMLFFRREKLSYLKLDEFFTGMLHKRIGQVIIKSIGLSLGNFVSSLTDANIKAIAKKLKSFEFLVLGNTGFVNSQVTAGGIKTSQFDNKTMCSKTNPNFYMIGEILDIDGDCGGFNLQWAWSSAFCAAEDILRNIK